MRARNLWMMGLFALALLALPLTAAQAAAHGEKEHAEQAMETGEKAMEHAEKAMEAGEKAMEHGEKAMEHGEKAMEHGEMSEEMAAGMEAWQKSMTPGEPHSQLAGAAGTWKMNITFWMDPSAPPENSAAIAQREMIMGGRYLAEKVDGTVMGMPFEGRGMTGYDNVSGKYWSAWIDNMSTGIMVSEGEEKDGKVVMMGTSNNPMTGGESKVKTVLWWEGSDTEHMEMFEERGGEWVKTMRIDSTRQASAE